MLGDNSWTCSAQNELNHGQSATLSIQFTVVAGQANSLYVCLSVCLSVSLSVCLSVCLSHQSTESQIVCHTESVHFTVVTGNISAMAC